MIVYHKNIEIDREQWDNCIRGSSCLKPYPYSWFLDIMSPGWEALIDDEYDSVFPIPVAGRFGVQYISVPAFIQQLGAFSPDKPSEKTIKEFLFFLPDFFKLVDLYISQKIEMNGFKVTEKQNFELDLSRPYETLRSSWTASCRRNVEAVEKKGLELASDIKPEELIDLFMLNEVRKLKELKLRDYGNLKSLMNFCQKNRKGRILGIRSGRGKLIHGVFIIETHGFTTLMLMATASKNKEKHLEYFSLNEIIRNSAGKHSILDFASISYLGDTLLAEAFGATKKPYYRIYRNRLFWPARILK